MKNYVDQWGEHMTAKGPEKRRKREKERRKKTILKAAKRQIIEKGSSSFTVDSVAKSAEVSKGSIYLYFDSKEDICIQLFLDEIYVLYKNINMVCDKKVESSEKLYMFSTVYAEFFINRKEVFKLFVFFVLNFHTVNFSEKVNKRIYLARDKIANTIDSMLKYGMKKEDFLFTEEVEKVRNALWGLLNGILSLHLFTGDEIKRDTRIFSDIKEGLDVFIRGLKKECACND